jgi:drug/metabolite transporter (DMT)-like permease
MATIGQTPTVAQVAGISLVCVGLLALTIDRLSKYPWRLIVAAAGAGLTVAGYSVLDAYGASRAEHWASFTAWLIIADSFTFLAVARIIRGRVLWTSLANEKRSAFISGMLGLASFSVFLWALSHHPVGAISALRETSVLFAVLLGVLFHGERLSLRRLCGALLIIGGIMRIAM